MINKKSIWFMTLFSLIIVLSVYYITIPKEINYENKPVVKIEESTILTALRVQADKEMESMLNDLRFILSGIDTTSEEKSNAYDKLKELNIIRGKEEKLEEMIKKTYNLSSFVKINDDQIRVVVLSDNHDSKIADNIMKSIQSEFETYKYISVKFE